MEKIARRAAVALKIRDVALNEGMVMKSHGLPPYCRRQPEEKDSYGDEARGSILPRHALKASRHYV